MSRSDNTSYHDNYGIVILAAGPSSRLGKPKQLLLYADKTLLQHIADEAAQVSHTVIMVIGARSQSIQQAIANETIQVVINEEWEEGMASSIRKGLEQLTAIKQDVKGVIITVCDQPYVTARLLNELIQKKEETKKGIIACSYAGTAGTPVLFDKAYFEILLALKGNGGAKKIVDLHEADTATVPFPQGAVDIDTEADYRALLQQ